MAYAGGHQLFNFLDRPYASPGSGGGAIQCGRGAGKIELPLEGPILLQPKDKCGVGYISRAGGVDYGNRKGGSWYSCFPSHAKTPCRPGSLR